jgi:hypothetical protein
MAGVYDKSHWPCHTEDLFWALSDSLENVGRLTNFDDESCEYIVDCSELPQGKYALWNFNALRNIRLGSDFPEILSRKLVSMTLCLGQKALENTTESSFSMFQNETILPLHILNDDVLTVRLMFRSLNENDRQLMPRHAIKVEGLLVRILDRSRPFFVAASKDVVLTWDGRKHRIFSKAMLQDEDYPTIDRFSSLEERQGHSNDRENGREVCREGLYGRRETDSDCSEEARVWHVVHNENTNFDDLWNASNSH